MSKRWLIFDDKYSFLHSFLGVILRIGAIEGLIGKVCSVIGFTTFLMYELIDNDNEIETLGDVIELIIGYVLTDIALT